MKRILFAAVFTFIVLSAFVLLEAVLRLSGAGFDTKPFIRHPYMGQFYIDNRQYRNKYYNRFIDFSKQPVKNFFSYRKMNGVLRGFVIGGSTAEGFPYYSNHSFSKVLETALRTTGHYNGVEILNMGFSAMSSFYDADTALKILDYDPDFIIIFSGHNEYYGTVSATTGGNFFIKKLYLSLKEFRIFQLLFNLFGDLTRPVMHGKTTMMAEQFNRKTLPRDHEKDALIAGDFIKNLDIIVKACSSRRVHVIVVEPACNLVDFPPFGGDRAGDLYREAKLFDEKNNGSGLSNYIAARDYDVIPFRARSEIYTAISNYSSHREEANPYYHFIPLQGLLTGKYGPGILGNTIFLDHVHFNITGHIIMAQILAGKLADIFHFDKKTMNRLTAFFNDPENVKKRIFFTPLNEFYAYNAIIALAAQPPFSTMRIPFVSRPPLSNPFFKDRSISGLSEDAAFNRIINDSISLHDYNKASYYINSIMWVYPEEYRNYLALAEFQEIVKNPDAVYNYITAYLLSGNSREVYEEMKTYFNTHGIPDLLETVEKRYGKPRD